MYILCIRYRKLPIVIQFDVFTVASFFNSSITIISSFSSEICKYFLKSYKYSHLNYVIKNNASRLTNTLLELGINLNYCVRFAFLTFSEVYCYSFTLTDWCLFSYFYSS